MTIDTSDGKRNRGIYLLPNLFTTAGLFSGFYAIVAAMKGHFDTAAIAIFITMIFDGLDGRVARLTNTESLFGANYDSICDMVSFGVAPALIAYQWMLFGLGKLGWLAAFIYVASTALRLARFNAQLESADKRFFSGLPCPLAAGVLAGFVWVGSTLPFDVHWMSIATALVTVMMGVLMASNIPYHSFKEVDFKNRVPFVAILVIVLVFVFISLDPPHVLFCMFLAYALSGPAQWVWDLMKGRKPSLNVFDHERDHDA
ncbi:MAG: phosphatidylserine synthase [marine bacterium B5-7]|nr:MAG: phosphatidylserine synthase [marine bacterium B5-7]